MRERGSITLDDIVSTCNNMLLTVARTPGTSAAVPRGGRISPSGEEGTTDSKTDGGIATLSLDDATRQRASVHATAASGLEPASLDDAWRLQQGQRQQRSRACHFTCIAIYTLLYVPFSH